MTEISRRDAGGRRSGTSIAVVAPSSIACKHAASADTLWLTCSCSSKTINSTCRRAWPAISEITGRDHHSIDALRLAQGRQCLLVKKDAPGFPAPPSAR